MTVKRAPEEAVQARGIDTFGRRFWGAVSATHYTGGANTLDGIQQHNDPEHVQIGGTLSLPLGRHPSLKLYGSTGEWSRSGSDYWLADRAPISLGRRAVGLRLQHREWVIG